jgi:hypothetical protein
LFGDFTINQRGPIGFSGMLAAVAAVLPLNGTTCLSIKGEPPIEPPDVPLIPLGGLVAKLSIASRTPTEHRTKASKSRRLKNPDGGFFIALFHWRL